MPTNDFSFYDKTCPRGNPDYTSHLSQYQSMKRSLFPYFLHSKRRRIEGGKGRESVVSYIVSSDYGLKLGQIRLATLDLQSISQGFPKGKSDKKKG